MGRMPLDVTNKVFGNLTALRIVGKYKRENVWECRCSCDKLVRVRICNLQTGNTQSCGCMRFKAEKANG